MKIWTTRDGKKIPYEQLTIPHILNIISYAKTHGFYASYVSRSIVDNTDNRTITYDCSREVIKDMYAELSRRKKI